MEFLGSKRGLTDFVTGAIGRVASAGTRVADLFCGTASVSWSLQAIGCRVTANDHLELCSSFAEAALLYDASPKSFGSFGGYEATLRALNEMSPDPGFIHGNYSPAGGRMYLTEQNAARVDAIRARITTWEEALTRGERARLMTDLVTAVSRVSNTAGTYGCYLKHWKPRALEPLVLTPALPVRDTGGHVVHCADAETVAPLLEAEIVYADPPYTKRQYAAYYHLLETIVVGDQPELIGSTGLRPWTEKASDWCYRRRAPQALRRLLDCLTCEHFFLSYSEDGQISDSLLREILGSYGQLNVEEVMYRRYRSNRGAHKGTSVRERIYHLQLA
jgi:adenine-specific DNA-methyltransferase